MLGETFTFSAQVVLEQFSCTWSWRWCGNLFGKSKSLILVFHNLYFNNLIKFWLSYYYMFERRISFIQFRLINTSLISNYILESRRSLFLFNTKSSSVFSFLPSEMISWIWNSTSTSQTLQPFYFQTLTWILLLLDPLSTFWSSSSTFHFVSLFCFFKVSDT